MNWDTQTLQRINDADDLKIAPFRSDGRTPGTQTWIWEVAVDGRLFVRAYNGRRSSWYQAALQQQCGQIHAVGEVFGVRFIAVDDAALNAKIDQAYRDKYASSPYMAHMIGPNARSATMEIVRQPCQAKGMR